MGMTTFNVVRTDDGKWRVNGQVQWRNSSIEFQLVKVQWL
jgi:hypothetical protein